MCPGKTAKFSQMAASVRAAQSWNTLPLNMSPTTIRQFQKNLKKWLENKPDMNHVQYFFLLFAAWKSDNVFMHTHAVYIASSCSILLAVIHLCMLIVCKLCAMGVCAIYANPLKITLSRWCSTRFSVETSVIYTLFWILCVLHGVL